METNPSSFVKDSISFVLESYELVQDFQYQIQHLKVVEIEHTGIGCLYSFSIKEGTLKSRNIEDNSILSDGCTVYVNDVGLEASLTVWIEKGIIDCLEILCHTGNYPINDPQTYYFKLNPVNYIDLS